MTGGKGKKKQSRLAFAPIQDSPPRRTDTSQSAFTPSGLRYTNPFTGKITVRGQLQLEDYVRSWGNSTADDVKEELSEVGQPSSEVDVKRNLTDSSSNQIPQSRSISLPHEDSSDDEVIRPSKRRRIATDTVNDNESDLESQPSASPSEANDLQNNNNTTTDGDSDMGRRPIKQTPRRRSQRLVASSPTETKARRNSLKTDLSNIGEPEDSDANELASPGTHRKRRGPRPKQKSPSVIDLDDSDVVITSHKRQKRKQADQTSHADTDEDEDGDDDIIAPTPSRRGSRRSPQKSVDTCSEEIPKTPRKYSQQDELDLEEDLEDLRDTVVREKRTRGSAINSARSNRQKHLEMLRRRRAGEKDISETDAEDEEEDDDEPQPHYASTAGINWDDYSRTRDDSDSDAPSIIEANEDLDADDSSFVEDDGELGVPGDVTVDVPFEFSRHRTKTTRDCFRDVVEWMVHSKLNPAFNRNDDVYQFAFIKVKDEVVGRAASQLISTVWNADFVNTLRARPHLDVTAHPLDYGHKCDACNRSKHPASSDLKFTGKPYSEETLEPLYESDDSDSDSDGSDEEGNSPDRDGEGHVLPSEDRHYYLGRTCKSNAVLTHTLIHWRFHLYEWVVDYLNHKEELLSNPQRSLDREKMSAKKRTKYANNVVDRMDEDGEVQRLWMDFHQNIRTVREMKDVRQF